MFFLLFGGGLRFKVLGSGDLRTCPRCRNESRWTRLRRFHQVTLFFVPILRWGRSEIEVCPVCGETDTVAACPAPVSPASMLHAT